MIVTSPPKAEKVTYPSHSVKRAELALFCAPFPLKLFQTMRHQSVPLQEMSGKGGLEKGYTQRLLSETLAEWELIWLIRVGLLRREVDGQGITDSFRLTPLGRQIIEKWEDKSDTLPIPSWWDRLVNTLTRWFSWFSN